MPSEIYRTASSSVVVLKDETLLEVRRGTLRGAALVDKRRWSTPEEWLAAVGEPLLEEAPVREMHEDTRFLQGLRARFPHSIAPLYEHHTAAGRLKMIKSTKRILEKEIAAIRAMTPNSSGQVQIREVIIHERHPFTNAPHCGGRSYYANHVPQTLIERYERHLPALDAACAEYTRKVLEERASPKFFVRKSSSNIFVLCDDGMIRPLYYHRGRDVFGVPGDSGFATGKTFAEMGIRPVQWYNQAFDQVLRKVQLRKKLNSVSH